MEDPFAQTQIPWYRRIVRKDRPTYAPKRLARATGAAGALAIYLLPRHHHSVETLLLAAGIACVPPVVLEASYKRRHRREQERLLALPQSGARAAD